MKISGRNKLGATVKEIVRGGVVAKVVMDFKGEDFAKLENNMLDVLRLHFRPEFLNRIDDIVIFDRISKEAMRAIVDVQLVQIARQVHDSRDIILEFDNKIKDSLAQNGYDPAFGARPLKRLIQKQILNPLAIEIIEGRVTDGQTIRVGISGDKAIFTAL